VDDKNNILTRSPLKLKAIRQAINSSINRDKLIMYMRNSIGTSATGGFVPSGLPSANAENVKGYPYNPGRARELMKEAGYENGKNFPLITLLTVPVYADIGSFVAKQLEESGSKYR
jgi:peptide/nickel transport system substrate-binding protein